MELCSKPRLIAGAATRDDIAMKWERTSLPAGRRVIRSTMSAPALPLEGETVCRQSEQRGNQDLSGLQRQF